MYDKSHLISTQLHTYAYKYAYFASMFAKCIIINEHVFVWSNEHTFDCMTHVVVVVVVVVVVALKHRTLHR